MTINKNLIRQTNLNRVISLLFQHQKLFSSEIVEATKISMVTTNSLVTELVSEGFLFEHPNKQERLVVQQRNMNSIMIENIHCSLFFEKKTSNYM